MATDTRATFWALLRADSSQAVTEFNKVSKATDGVSKTTTSLESRFSSSMKKIAVATGVGFGTAAIVNFTKSSINAASRLEQSMGATEAVFRNNSVELDQWAEGAAKAMGLSEAAARESLSLIGAQLKNFGYNINEAQSEGQKLVQLGADLAATFGGPTTDAVSAITAALRGERDPIERYGVSLNEATVKAKALEMGLYSGRGEISLNAKATASLALIYQQTADAAGQFAREVDTVAGANAVAAANSENAAASLGEALAPAYAEAVKLATKFSEIVVDVAGSDMQQAAGLDAYVSKAKTATTTNGQLLRSFMELAAEVEESRSAGERIGNMWNAGVGGLTDFNSDSEALRQLDRFREAWHLLLDLDPAQAKRLLDVIDDLKVAADNGVPAAKEFFDTYALGGDELAGMHEDLMGYNLGLATLNSTEVTATLATREHNSALLELNAQYETSAGKIDAVRLSAIKLNDYLAGLAHENTWMDIEDQFDDLKKAADEAWYASASGSADAEAKGRDYQRMLNDSQLDLADYLLNVEKLPAERVTQILAAVDEGSISTAEGLLRAIAASRTAKIYVQPVFLKGVGGGGPSDGDNYWDTHANGGVASGWSMVGERGPELVNFSSPGRVYSNNESQRMMGGGGVTIINNGVITYDDFETEVVAAIARKSKDNYTIPGMAAA